MSQDRPEAPEEMISSAEPPIEDALPESAPEGVEQATSTESEAADDTVQPDAAEESVEPEASEKADASDPAAESTVEESDGDESAESEAPAEPAPKAAKVAKRKKKTVVKESQEPKEPGWFVLRVQSGREDSIANNLRKKLALTDLNDLVEEVVVPKQNITEIKEGKKRTRKQKLFPGYIFVHARLEDDLWYLIRDSSGIGDFISSGTAPIPMAEAEVRKVLDIMEEKEEAPQVKIDLMKNDTVKITEGPFENFDGVVEEVNPSKGIVRVMVTIFGRSTPVDLEYWQVEKL